MTRIRLRPFVVLLAVATVASSRPSGGGSRYLYVWAGPAMPLPAGATHADDFIAVLNADPADSNYGKLITSVDAGFPGVMAHHTEFTLPSGHPFFASDFMSGQVVLIDLEDPLRPRVVRRIDSVPGFKLPHSFVRLPNGNVIATLQFGGPPGDTGRPGGLAEFDPSGTLLRTGSGADPAFRGAHIRTYGLELLPAIDRAITTSSPMSSEKTADVIQIWRISDLHVLKTIPIEGVNGDSTGYRPFEVRALPDGKTALMNSYACGFYLLTGLDGDQPKATRVHAMPGRYGCSVPVIVGHYWVMPIAFDHSVAVLDIADPSHPAEVSRLSTESKFFPHWSSADPLSDRIVITGQGNGDARVLIARLDQANGKLTWDARFHDAGSTGPGIAFSDLKWTHGQIANATPHGALFGPAPVK